VDDTSVRAGDPFDYAASRRHDDPQERERDCFYCLSGWVFLGSIRHSTPGAEAGYCLSVGAPQDQHVGVRAIQDVAGRQARFLGWSRPSDQPHRVFRSYERAHDDSQGSLSPSWLD
jgi:hypothetical protein